MKEDEKLHAEQAWDDRSASVDADGAPIRRGSVMVGHMVIENPLQVRRRLLLLA